MTIPNDQQERENILRGALNEIATGRVSGGFVTDTLTVIRKIARDALEKAYPPPPDKDQS